MEASHKTHRPHIKVGKDEEEEEDGKYNVISKHDIDIVESLTSTTNIA